MDAVYKKIVQRLYDLEIEEDVKILYACESGSRAWGFESQNSDWDVRFIYLRSPDWYLSIDERKRDVIELGIDEDDLDISGWDIQKALLLFRKSNSAMLEWLDSPIVYDEDETFMEGLLDLRDRVFNPRGTIHHYLAMARGNYREYLKRDEVRLKKYLYVLRPVIASLWIRWHGTMPPTLFDTAIDDAERNGTIDQPTLAMIRALLEEKKRGFERDSAPKIEILNAFAEQKLEELEKYVGDAASDDRLDYLVFDHLLWNTMDRFKDFFQGRTCHAREPSNSSTET